MNFHKELKDLNLWARYYTANGINTPLTDIDVEIVKLNQKWNVFLLSYTKKKKTESLCKCGRSILRYTTPLLERVIINSHFFLIAGVV